MVQDRAIVIIEYQSEVIIGLFVWCHFKWHWMPFKPGFRGYHTFQWWISRKDAFYFYIFYIIQLQIIDLLNLWCNVPLTFSPLVIAVFLVTCRAYNTATNVRQSCTVDYSGVLYLS